MDVYRPNAFEDRVNYAASCIVRSKGVPQGRHFDTCFEMGDGDFVAAALVRRARKSPLGKLAERLFFVINPASSLAAFEETKTLTRKQLHDAAVTHCVQACKVSGYSE